MSRVDPNSDLLVFSEFIQYLRHREFAIGTHQYLRLHALLNKLDEDCALSDLKTLLCPIFATNRFEQEQFYSAFDSFFGAFQTLMEAQGEGGDGFANDKLHAPLISQWRHVVIVLRTLLAAFIFFMALVTLSDNRSIDTKNPPVDTPVATLPDPALQPPQIEKINKPPQKPVETLPTKTTAPDPSFWQKYGRRARLIISLAPLIFFLGYEAYLFNKRRLVLQRQRKKKPPYLYPLSIPATSPGIYNSEQFYDVARLLRRRQTDEFFRLDINATITATIESAGYPCVRYKPDSKPSEYLVLIDRAAIRDHQALLFEEMVKALSNEQVLIERFFYEGDPRICFGQEGAAGIYLSDLQRQFARHRLIIFSDGKRLVNPLTGDLESWVSMFQEWPERALLTPKSVPRWGLMEICLASQFLVLPATLNGVKTLTQYFDSSVIPSRIRLQQTGDWESVDTRNCSELVLSLRRQLGEETFQWLCACAVYPELQWDLTLYLGSLPCMPRGIANEENLLRLIRLPWLRQGSMPDELRYGLILELEKTREKAIRFALVELLERNPPDESLTNTYANDSYQLNLAIQRWLLHPNYKRFRDALKVIKSLPASQAYKDQTVIRFLKVRSSSPLHLILPERVRKLFYRDGIAAFGSRAIVRVLLTSALIAIAWFGIKLPRPIVASAQESSAPKFVVLVAKFGGPEPSRYKTTEILIDQLRKSTQKYSEVEIKALDQVIAAGQGSAEARRIGEEHQASLVLWGSYGIKSDSAYLYIHYEVLSSLKTHVFESYMQRIEATPGDMNSFKIQTELSDDMSYLALSILGIAHYEVSDYAGAIACFTDALNLPVSLENTIRPAVIHAYRGYAYILENDLDRAIEDYTQAISLSPDLADAYVGRGMAYDRKGERNRALADYKIALSLNPDLADAYFNSGYDHEEKGEHDLAIADYNKAISLKPDYADAYHNRGTAYDNKREYYLAIDDYTKAISLNPNEADAYNNRGNTYDKNGEVDLAIADYSKAIRLKPDYADAYHNRGTAYDNKGEYNLAIADYSKAIDLKPDYADAYHNRANSYDKNGEFDRALTDYGKAIELKPDDAQSYFDRGIAYDNKGNYDLAIADYSKAIDLKPNDADAYVNRGFAHDNKGEYDLAIADYDKAISLKPDNADAYVNRGFAYHKKGEHDLAIADYNKAISLKPDDATAYNNRGYTYDTKGEYDLAIADCNKALSLDPVYAETYDTRATAYKHKGEYDLAIADYNKALSLKPDLVESYFNRGSIYEAQGKPDLAIADYSSAIRIKPDYAEAYVARGVVLERKGLREQAASDFSNAQKLMTAH